MLGVAQRRTSLIVMAGTAALRYLGPPPQYGFSILTRYCKPCHSFGHSIPLSYLGYNQARLPCEAA